MHRERGATHTVTHTRKRTDGNNGTNRLRPHPFWTKNRPKALYSSGWMAFERLVRMRSAVRICPAAPKKHRKLRFSMLFVAKMLKCAERVKEYRRGGFAPSPIFLMFFFCSHHLCHEAAHRLCSFILLLPCGVGVGSQGKACIVVPQHTADRFHVHTVL